MGKVCKLWIHQSNFSEKDLVVNPKDYPNGVKERDIIEIYQVFEDGSSTCKLLLQIKSLQTDFQQKETISIKHSVANQFKFRAYWDVNVQVVDPTSFILDLVEVKFKDQYFSRSDMWRFGKTLVNSSVYMSKKFSFAGARGEFYEMWANGDSSKKVTCGVVGEDTRVVFRSGSASVFIFMQMSKEMWEFDINGDLYFEKTVNGFLRELFTKWKEIKCNHAVTIVYFSRIFYEENILDGISGDYNDQPAIDYKGRMYKDIYYVIVHEERRDDWSTVLVTLKKHFIQYRESFQKENLPKCHLSSASEGNFLEVLNLGANVFEKAYIDLNLDVTGQQMVVITPGAGMFEVDRKLATLTKQKIVDYGMSADLVCMAEQPLHSVPLLKFHEKISTNYLIGDDYCIPHWINHSFYTSKYQQNHRNIFIPRIKVPDIILQFQGVDDNKNPHKKFLSKIHSEEAEKNKLPDFVDYDAYDADVFKCAQTKPRPQTVTPGCNPYTPGRETRKAADTDMVEKFLESENLLNSNNIQRNKSSSMLIKKRKTEDVDYVAEVQSLQPVKSLGYILPRVSYDEVDGFDNNASSYSPPFASRRAVVGSADTSQVYHNVGRPQRALVNPFRPNYLPCKLTCNRHRWRHTFPKGPGGKMIQEHHQRISENVDDGDLLMSLFPAREIEQCLSGLALGHFDEDLDQTDRAPRNTDGDFPIDQPVISPQNRPLTAGSGSLSSKHMNINAMNLGWVGKLHAPSEEDWTAAMKTTVDWKSLTIPACLPVTTDFFPDERLLNNHYKVHNYELFIGEEDDEDAVDTSDSQNQGDEKEICMKSDKIFKEFISQRIAQGFQLISSNVNLSRRREVGLFSPTYQSRVFSGVIPKGIPDEEYYFMMGRNFHKLTLSSGQVSFTRYHPTHVIKIKPVSYHYLLWSECRQECVEMKTQFVYDDLTNYNWNYLDQYVSRDSDCLHLIDSLNYWRVRLVLLPLKKPMTFEAKSVSSDADEEEKRIQFTYLQGILRFLETVNQIKRPAVTRFKTKKPAASQSRKFSVPCVPVQQNRSPTTARRSHRRSRSGGGTKDMEIVVEDMVTSDEKSRSSSIDRDSTEDVSNAMPSSEEIVKAMQAKETGINFLPEMRGLPPGSFLGTDATSWFAHHVPGVNGRSRAVELGQKMIDDGFIQHASGSMKQPFVDGFYLYYLLKASERNQTKKPDESDGMKYRIWKKQQDDLLYSFQARWFEVAMRERGSECTCSPFGRFSESEGGERKSSSGSFTSDGSRTRIPAFRDAEINLVEMSGRPEWCTVRYYGIFCPDNAYVVELRWLISTGSVINQLVQSWARKVVSYGFHLVPAGTFLNDGKPARRDPFTRHHFISLNETSLELHVSKRGLSAQEYRTSVFLIQEAILKRFGFIKDFPYNVGIYKCHQTSKKVSTFRYIHYTGALFFTIVDHRNEWGSYGFVWMLNNMLTKRWKSSVTLDNEGAKKLLQEFREFCENKNGELASFVASLDGESCEAQGSYDGKGDNVFK